MSDAIYQRRNVAGSENNLFGTAAAAVCGSYRNGVAACILTRGNIVIFLAMISCGGRRNSHVSLHHVANGVFYKQAA